MEIIGGRDVEELGILIWSLGIGLVIGLLVLYLNTKKEGWNLSYNVIRQRRKLRRQGIGGPPPSLLHGNAPELQRIVAQSKRISSHGTAISHDFVAAVFPHFHHWAKEYRNVYTYTNRKKQNLYINNLELVREMNQNMSTTLGKPTFMTKQLFPLFGNGILRANSALWSRQRKIISPEFYMDKVKGMVGLMREASELMVKKWEASIIRDGDAGEKAVEIRLDEDLISFSADVIARACFGSSYAKGKHIFTKLRTLQRMLSSHGHFYFNNSRSFRWRKSEKEREILRLEKEVNNLIWETVQERGKQDANTKDLMQLLLQSSDVDDNKDEDSKKDFIIDNCKNIYFAGHETTAVSSAWCLVLLASYPDWQTRLRQELLQEPNQPPSFDALNKMKWLNMFIQEALRLYSPGAFVTREALEDVKIGDLVVPKGVLIWSLIPALHRDPEQWGPDALDFKPERFAGGVANACKVPQAYIPWGVGPRNCLGKNFALIELKIILSHILANFTISMSPNYHHSPGFSMVVGPSQPVYLLMKKNG